MCMIIVFRPETATYVKRMEQDKAEKAKGQQADNRSFFAKYVSLEFYLLIATSGAKFCSVFWPKWSDVKNYATFFLNQKISKIV